MRTEQTVTYRFKRVFLGACALMLAISAAPGLASADSGVLNLHLDLGPGVPLVGDFTVADASG